MERIGASPLAISHLLLNALSNKPGFNRPNALARHCDARVTSLCVLPLGPKRFTHGFGAAMRNLQRWHIRLHPFAIFVFALGFIKRAAVSELRPCGPVDVNATGNSEAFAVKSN